MDINPEHYVPNKVFVLVLKICLVGTILVPIVTARFYFMFPMKSPFPNNLLPPFLRENLFIFLFIGICVTGAIFGLCVLFSFITMIFGILACTEWGSIS